jgi:hypothetical protein
MRTILFLSFIIGFTFLNSQEVEDHFKSLHSTHSIGVNCLTKDSIYAEDISFVNNISDFVFDTTNKVLLSYFALCGEDGKTNFDYITAYSTGERKVLWSKLVDRTKEKYDFINGKLFLNSPKFNGLVDIMKDTFIWKTKSNILVHNDLIKKNIVLAPRHKDKEGIKVCAALNAMNGEPFWINDSLELKMGIVSEPTVKDDQIIFLNEHLINLNLTNGKYWKSESRMNKILGKDEKIIGEVGLTFLSAAIGFGVASALGSSAFSYSIVDLGPTGLKTNAPLYINDSGFIFVVGIEGMKKYSQDGVMLASIGHTNRNNIEKILIARNQMYYLDPGGQIYNNIRRPIFNSYFYLSKLSPNLETEKSIHLSDGYQYLNKELGHFHIKTEFLNDNFYVLFRNGVLVLDTNLTIIGKFTRTKKEDPEYRNLLLGNFYEFPDSVWQKRNYNEGYVYLERDDKSIDVIDSRFQFVRNIPRKDIYKINYQEDIITVVVNTDGKSFLLDKHDRTIIDMLRIEKIQKYKNQYYIANLNGYYIINADQLVK